jgi:hypothetical protein
MSFHQGEKADASRQALRLVTDTETKDNPMIEAIDIIPPAARKIRAHLVLIASGAGLDPVAVLQGAEFLRRIGKDEHSIVTMTTETALELWTHTGKPN